MVYRIEYIPPKSNRTKQRWDIFLVGTGIMVARFWSIGLLRATFNLPKEKTDVFCHFNVEVK